ncbi:MAG: F0F1 ATP synthase subunit gamma [Bacteroidaceae bacterium]|jgi:F-type H+-transporting ATPase subunit gamma|nr:F0F1 ATP synthase subunit gamma [Bacteroidaceae bacterium]
MASLKEIKNRITSVQSTRKITSAMKMVASSKLHHAQVMIENMLPYESMLETILKSFLAANVDAKSIITKKREVKNAVLIVYASNTSLCGGFNANVIKKMTNTVEEYQRKGINVIIYPISRKVADKAKKLGYTIGGDYQDLAEKPHFPTCVEIGQELGKKFGKGEIDQVELIFHHFKSAGSQILTKKRLIPIDIEEAMDYDHTRDLKHVIANEHVQEYLKEQGGHKALKGERSESEAKEFNDNFIIEPDMRTILQALIPKYVNLMIYTALLDSNASEHAARMVAMQTATDNADDLLHDLTLTYNKTRQAAITTELLDIMGGSFQ